MNHLISYINKNSISIMFVENGNHITTKSYLNSEEGRKHIELELSENIVVEVMEIWGDAPTVIFSDDDIEL